MFYYPSSLLHSLFRIQLLKWTAVKRWSCHPAINWSWKLANIVIAACEWNKDHNCFSFHSLHLLGTVIDWWDPHFHQHAHTFSPFSLSSVVLCRALQQEVGRGGYQIAFTRDGVRDIERREGTKDKRRRGILSSDALILPRLQSASFTSTGACSDANTWPWLSGRTCPSGSPYTSPGPSHAALAPTPGSFVTSVDRKLFGILYTGERWCSIFPDKKKKRSLLLSFTKVDAGRGRFQ